MRRRIFSGVLTVVVVVLMVSETASAGTTAAQPSAKAIKLAYAAITFPQFDRSRHGDPNYVNQFHQKILAVAVKKAKIAERFYQAYPDDPAALGMLQLRWQVLIATHQPDKAIQETDAYLQTHPRTKGDPQMLLTRAEAAISSHRVDATRARRLVETFVKVSPGDPNGWMLLLQLAGQEPVRKQAMAIYQQIEQKYAQTQAAMEAESKIAQMKKIGQPFHLAFDDAISGRHVSIAALKGKVVVVDFWATWCPPCVAAVPRLKKLYAKWHDKGVQFIGVSLDRPRNQGGLNDLLSFVKTHHMTWPQYYQGHTFTATFSSQWYVTSIPTTFVVDQAGNLYSVRANDKLGRLIPQLLAHGAPSARGPAHKK